MIYDTTLSVYTMGTATATARTLQHHHDAYCGNKEVYSGRFYAAMQAGTRIDRMVELWRDEAITADMFAVISGTVYRVIQAQHGTNDAGLPITTLSLKQEAATYELNN